MQVTTSSFGRVARTVVTNNVGGPPERERDKTYITSSFGVNGFIKPDTVVRNPKVDGYRKPSSYSCPAIHGGMFRVNLDIVPKTTLIPQSSQRVYTEGGFVGTVWISDLPVTNFNVNNVRMKVLNNARSEVFDVAMVLAEISGTANTLTTGLLRLARSMDAVKRRKPENFFYLLNGRRRDGRRPTDKFLRESAGVYLEWKYGIMPTVYDIAGASKALDMSQDGSLFDNPPLLVARAVDRNTVSAASAPIRSINGYHTGHTTEPVKAFTVTDELKARLDYRVSGEGIRGLNRYGLGLSSVATVAFDKTPFSFVLNMAVPIADLIKAWSALAGCDVVGYCETRYRRVDVASAEALLPERHHPLVCNVKQLEAAFMSFSRSAFAKPPMPMPFVRNPVKVGNVSTVLALFTQLRSPQGYD